jgi:hypothetical protein
MFDFKVGEEVKKLGWGIWAMRRYCEVYQVDIEEYFKRLSTNNIDFDDVVKFLRIALEYGSRGSKQFTEFDACELIDADGGLINGKGQVKAFFEWIIKSHTVDVKQDEEKKSLNEPSV